MNKVVKGQNVLIVDMGVVAPVFDVVQVHGQDTIQVYFKDENTMRVYNDRQIEPIASEVFKIGDKVEAIYPGNCGFRGEVVAFESSTNRVICKSYNVNTKDRSRYAYKVGELSISQNITFEPGRTYLINDKHEVLAVKANRETVTLISLRDMAIVYSSINTTLNKQTAKQRGIHKVICADTGCIVNFAK